MNAGTNCFQTILANHRPNVEKTVTGAKTKTLSRKWWKRFLSKAFSSLLMSVLIMKWTMAICMVKAEKELMSKKEALFKNNNCIYLYCSFCSETAERKTEHDSDSDDGEYAAFQREQQAKKESTTFIQKQLALRRNPQVILNVCV